MSSTIKTLRITGVPEHFNYPLRLLERQQPLLKAGIELVWKEESRGSGQLLQDLKSGDTDLALLLTESFLKDCASGGQNKMLGYHVLSPLIWGIHESPRLPHSLAENSKKNFFVSRMGSGSHLMAQVLAAREGWPMDSLTFQIIDNLDGAIAAYARGEDGYFLWEKYTTSPAVAQGSLVRTGELPSPWPCFVWVASPQALESWGENLLLVRNEVYEISKALVKQPDIVERLAQEYQLSSALVNEWLAQTSWCTEATLPPGSLVEVIEQVRSLGIIELPLHPEDVMLLENQ
jgi:DNA-binding transcriptional LysR family regulator